MSLLNNIHDDFKWQIINNEPVILFGNEIMNNETIEKIINYDLSKLNALELMEKQYNIIKQLTFNFIDRCEGDKDQNSIISCSKNIGIEPKNNLIINNINYGMVIKWLLKVTRILSKKIKCKVVKHKGYDPTTNPNPIPRSSYKFCRHTFACQYNYNTKYSGCYAQHYVHHILYADIRALLMYIRFVEIYDIKEIKISLKTIMFVIEHMYNELKNLSSNLKEPIDDLHIEKTPN